MSDSKSQRTYFDYAATTPVDPSVLEVMLPYFSDQFGNPSSVHMFGQRADSAVEAARSRCAEALNCSPSEIIFTSCGSESDNLAIRGTALAVREQDGRDHILTTKVEHEAVTHTFEQLEKYNGFNVEYIPVNKFGNVDPETLRSMLTTKTSLVSIMYANNEIGSINPINELGKVCAEAGVYFHTDAVQGSAYLPIDLQVIRVDLLSIGAHKMYGPKGVGILYIKQGTPLIPAQTGGGQESGLRSGTSNVPLIVGQAEALVNIQKNKFERAGHYKELQGILIAGVLDNIPYSKLTGHPIIRLPNHASFVFKDVDGNQLLMQLDMGGFACSSGSACKTGNPEPSRVLTEIGFERDWALGSLRVTLGTSSQKEDIERFIKILPDLVLKNRKMQGAG
jgi:cysteine desulfurase